MDTIDYTPGWYFWNGQRWETRHGWYRLTGGRQIDWMFVEDQPTNYALDGENLIIDLDDVISTVEGVPGVAGADGATSGTKPIYRRSATPLTAADTPTGGTFNPQTGVYAMLPMGWSEFAPAGTDSLWVSTALIFARDEVLNLAWSQPQLLAGSLIVTTTTTGATITDTFGNSVDIVDGFNPTVTAVPGGVEITDANGDTVTVTDGNTGADGDGLEVIYRVLGTQPTTPDPSIGAPADWSFILPTNVPAGQFLWLSVGTRNNNTGSYTWTPAIQFSPSDIELMDVANGVSLIQTTPDGTTMVTITNGTDGTNPTVTAISGGVRVTDGEGNSVDVLGGSNGMDGDGLEAIYILSLIHI